MTPHDHYIEAKKRLNDSDDRWQNARDLETVLSSIQEALAALTHATLAMTAPELSERSAEAGCCPTCEGTGTNNDESTNGRRWDCQGTSHASPICSGFPCIHHQEGTL